MGNLASGSMPAGAPQWLAGLDPGVVWAIALVVALAYSIRSGRLLGLDPRSMYWTGACAYLGGLWGGHLMGLAVHGWQGGPLGLLAFWDGAKSYYGGLLGGG